MNPMPTPEQARGLYATVVASFAQADPILLFCTKDAMIPVQIRGVGPMTPLPYVVAQVLDGISAEHGRPVWLMLSYESWVAFLDSIDQVDAMKPGDVRERASIGDPTVKDAVTIYAISADEAWQSVQTFERNEEGAIAWDEPNLAHEDGMSGDTYDLLVAAVRQ